MTRKAIKHPEEEEMEDPIGVIIEIEADLDPDPDQDRNPELEDIVPSQDPDPVPVRDRDPKAEIVEPNIVLIEEIVEEVKGERSRGRDPDPIRRIEEIGTSLDTLSSSRIFRGVLLGNS
jgi:hypothetical protein